MSRVAAHAVWPVCSRCGRRVRGSLEVAAAVSELRELVARSRALAASGGVLEGRLHEAVLSAVEREIEVLQAELAGAHRDAARCRAVSGGGTLEALASAVARRACASATRAT